MLWPSNEKRVLYLPAIQQVPPEATKQIPELKRKDWEPESAIEMTLPDRELSQTLLQLILIFGKVLLHVVSCWSQCNLGRKDNVHSESVKPEGRIGWFNLTLCSSWAAMFHTDIALFSPVAFPWLKCIIKSKLTFFWKTDKNGKYAVSPGSLIQS